jgi:Zn finger protein HypA/HybF involved in hydrogenase expression
MPTTECHCNTCGQRFEHLVFKGDRIDPICPRCKKRDITTNAEPERFMTGSSLGLLIADVPKGPS